MLVGAGVWPKHARCGNFVEIERWISVWKDRDCRTWYFENTEEVDGALDVFEGYLL